MKKYVQLEFNFLPWDDEKIWRDIIEEGFEGIYQGSNFGRIRSLDRWVNSKNGSKSFVKGKILKPHLRYNGYQQVHLYKNGKGKMLYVHRLVYEAFIGEIPKGMQVNHKDENKQNNILSNIDTLMTCKENINWGTRNKRSSKSLTNNPKKSKSVIQKSLEGEVIKVWTSVNEVQRQLGYDNGSISACCRGGCYKKGKWVNIKQMYGFIWQYTDKAAS